MSKMRLNKDKWVPISRENQDRAETQQPAWSIDNPSVSVTCAARYHIRQQYDSPHSLTYYVGSHDSCKLHLSRQGPKILWHAITQTHTHTHSHIPRLLSHTHHPRTEIGSDAAGNMQWETLESCQSKEWNNKMTGCVLMPFWGNANEHWQLMLSRLVFVFCFCDFEWMETMILEIYKSSLQQVA